MAYEIIEYKLMNYEHYHLVFKKPCGETRWIICREADLLRLCKYYEWVRSSVRQRFTNQMRCEKIRKIIGFDHFSDSEIHSLQWWIRGLSMKQFRQIKQIK